MSVLLLLLSLLLLQAQNVSTSATFEWMILNFKNPNGLDYDGNACDVFAGECDHVFRFGLDWLQGSTDVKDTPILTKITEYFPNENSNDFPSNTMVKGIYNPITHQFDTWPGGLLLKTFVEDDDAPLKSPDTVDKIIFKIIATPDISNSASVAKKETASGRRTTLTFTWRAFCDLNYYGLNCSKLCRPQDDSVGGHFTCDSNGDKVCLAGWDNPANNCLDKSDDCTHSQCKNNADCIADVRPYRCICKPGFTGKYCETKVDQCQGAPCQNGATCVDGTNDYKCTCPSGFVGKNCSENACTKASPCQNGGTCHGDLKCFCPPNYVGDTCADPICKVTGCLNGGGCTINGSCVCKPGFVGETCGVELCGVVRKFCKNGGVCVEGKCVCPKEFAGDACEESLLCGGVICENDGECKIVENAAAKKQVPKCVCPQGYSGARCELQVKQNSNPLAVESPRDSASGSLSIFGILFIIFVVLSICLLIVVIVLTILLCRTKRRKHRNRLLSSATTVSSPSSPSSVYSTVTDVFRETVSSNKTFAALPNIYGDFAGELKETEREFEGKETGKVSRCDVHDGQLEEVHVPSKLEGEEKSCY